MPLLATWLDSILFLDDIPFSELLLSRSLTEPCRRFLLLHVNFPVCMFSFQVDNKPRASLPVPCTEWPFNARFLIRLCIHDITVEFVPPGHISTRRETAALWPTLSLVHLIRALSCPSDRKRKVRFGLLVWSSCNCGFIPLGRTGSFHNHWE